MSSNHTLIGDKLHIYRRDNSPFWQCSTYLAGRNHRTTTKERDLEHAKKLAEEWYLTLQIKNRAGEFGDIQWLPARWNEGEADQVPRLLFHGVPVLRRACLQRRVQFGIDIADQQADHDAGPSVC